MPIFEYLCSYCGKRFEELMSRSKTERVCCPGCQSDQVTRLFSTFGVASEGSGLSVSEPSSSGSGGCCGGACGCSH